MEDGHDGADAAAVLEPADNVVDPVAFALQRALIRDLDPGDLPLAGCMTQASGAV